MYNATEVSAAERPVSSIFRRNRLLLLMSSVPILSSIAVGVHLQTSFWASTASTFLSISSTLLLFMLANFLLLRLGVAIFRVKPKKPIGWLIADIRGMLSDGVRAPDALIAYLSMISLILCYTFLKDQIHSLNPSLWDIQFAELDRSIHGGQDAWKLLWPALGTPYATTFISAAYHVWFPMVYLAICIACLDRRDASRCTVFMVAFILTWFIGGNLLATIFTSVGPVYYEAFGLGDTFTPQMELLRQSHEVSPVWALSVQERLLSGYLNGGAVSGISAMPSMHVASTVILTLYAFSYSRRLGWAMTAFTAIILLGSVHLGWHYAVDGYASILLALLFWWIANKLTTRFGPSA